MNPREIWLFCLVPPGGNQLVPPFGNEATDYTTAICRRRAVCVV